MSQKIRLARCAMTAEDWVCIIKDVNLLLVCSYWAISTENISTLRSSSVVLSDRKKTCQVGL